MSHIDVSMRVDTAVMRKIMRNLPGDIERFMDEEAETVVNDIVKSFGTSPSAPNDPPGVDTGALRASMTWRNGGEYRRIVEDGVEYGIYLEFGTDNIIQRPFVRPAFKREEKAFGRHAEKAGLIKP